MDEVCTYCGMPRGERLSCCGENHWMTQEEFDEYHGNEEAEWYDALNLGYAQDRI